MQVLSQDPVAPRTLIPQLDRDIETISLKAMEKTPEHRYDSAAALREDLNRYISDYPIYARPVSRLEHASVGAFATAPWQHR